MGIDGSGAGMNPGNAPGIPPPQLTPPPQLAEEAVIQSGAMEEQIAEEIPEMKKKKKGKPVQAAKKGKGKKGGKGGGISDLSPEKLAGMSDEQIKTQAGRLQQAGSPLDKDSLVNALKYMRDNANVIGDEQLNKLAKESPVLAAAIGGGDVGNIQKAYSKGNRFLRPNRMSAYTDVFLTLMAKLSQAKQEEGLMGAELMMDTWGLAKEIANTIIKKSKVEAMGHFMQMGAKLMSAGISLGGAGTLRGSGTSSTFLKGQMRVQGASSLAGAMGDAAQGVTTLRAGQLEAQRTILEHVKDATRKIQSSLDDDQQKLNDFIQSLLQTKQSLDDSISRHGSLTAQGG